MSAFDRQEGSFGARLSRLHHPESLAGQFLQAEEQEDTSDDREKLPPQYRRGLLQQLADMRDDATGEPV